MIKEQKITQTKVLEKEIQINKSFLDIQYQDRIITKTIEKEVPVYVNITKEIPVEVIKYKEKIITEEIMVDTNGTSLGDCVRVVIPKTNSTVLDCGEEVYRW